MKFPLRPTPVLVATFLSLCVCAAIYPGETARAASMSTPPDTDSAKTRPAASPPMDSVVIPGPLRSLLRMAGVSQKISPDEVLPLLARNIYLRGYMHGVSTEFLILI